MRAFEAVELAADPEQAVGGGEAAQATIGERMTVLARLSGYDTVAG